MSNNVLKQLYHFVNQLNKEKFVTCTMQPNLCPKMRAKIDLSFQCVHKGLQIFNVHKLS